jgi:hypothetical protein
MNWKQCHKLTEGTCPVSDAKTKCLHAQNHIGSCDAVISPCHIPERLCRTTDEVFINPDSYYCNTALRALAEQIHRLKCHVVGCNIVKYQYVNGAYHHAYTWKKRCICHESYYNQAINLVVKTQIDAEKLTRILKEV